MTADLLDLMEPPFMHPESMTAIVEVRVIEGMTMAGVHDELRSALARAGLADRVEILAADPPHGRRSRHRDRPDRSTRPRLHDTLNGRIRQVFPPPHLA